MNAPLRTRERRDIPLDLITGRSPFNCRPTSDAESVAEIAASIEAVGLIQPLLASRVPGDIERFWIDDGGQRWDALCALREAGKLDPEQTIPCDVLIAEEAAAREISLLANVMRRDLHPVDQCAAFEAMIAAGKTPEGIAGDFHITAKQVRQRLKLAKLSPTVRDRWRAGTLSTEAAQAMTAGATHEAQDALLASADEDPFILRNPSSIRRRLLGEHIRGDSPAARYVGLDAYVAAGGAIDENLFEDHPLFLDGELLTRLAREKLLRDGDAILQKHGLAFCMIRAEVSDAYAWPRVEPDYRPDEKTRLVELEGADPRYDVEDGDPPARPVDRQDDETDDAWEDRIQAEQDAIEARGLDRAMTPEMRAKTGIFLDIAADGTLVVERGILQREERRAPAADGKAGSARKSGGTASSTKPADPIEAAGSGMGAIREILDATIRKALVAVVTPRPDLALLFLVARLGPAYAPYHLETFGLLLAGERFDGLVAKTQDISFDLAIDVCAGATTDALLAALATIIARSIKPTRSAKMTELGPLMRAFARRGAPLREAFVSALDYERYFEAATRAACLAAADALQVEHLDRAAKKPVIAALVAAEAQKKGWLPFPLDQWAAIAPDVAPPAPPKPVDTTSLADAMDKAIAVDERKRAVFDAWFDAHVDKRSGARIKAADLYGLYQGETVQADLLSLPVVSQLVAQRGIAKHRYAAGVHYLDVALKDGR